MAQPSSTTFDVVVVGAGVVGLTAAWRAARAGHGVALVDPSPGRGASWAAAGMLAPVTEAAYGEEPLLALNLTAAASYPSFVAELEEATGEEVGYRTCGTLTVAGDAGDRAVLRDLHDFQASLGLKTDLLSARDARHLEPYLAPGVSAALLADGDHQVDPRRLCAALLAGAKTAGVQLVRQGATEVLVAGGRVKGVAVQDGGILAAGAAVVAAGCWSGRLAGVPPDAVSEVRPVKGQILRLAGPGDRALLGRTVRGVVAGSHVYLVPRSDGRVVVGATVEEQGFDTTVRAGAVYELLRDAMRLVPGVAELELVEVDAGLRPGSPDNAPLVGPTEVDGLAVATGHYRNGVLLAPGTADALASWLAGGRMPKRWEPFSPARLASYAGRVADPANRVEPGPLARVSRP